MIQPVRSDKKWISANTKQEIVSRDKLKEEANRNNDPEAWSKYRRQRNKIVELVRRDKKGYLENLFTEADRKMDTRNLFRMSKEVLGWGGAGPPTSLVTNGNLIAKPREIAETSEYPFQRKSYKSDC